jgi:gliding motility-associated-like protein
MYADASTYFWQFGDNQGTSNAVNPTYTYYEPGIYSVSLTAANALGETSNITKHAIIEVYERPSAQFNLKPRIVYTPGGTLYTDNQSFGASSYLWDFGDGTTSTDYEPEHIYTATGEGSFDVSLIAYNEWGCTDTLKVPAAVRVQDGGQLLIPNAFSPNLSGPGSVNGENDVFLPLMRGVHEFQMMVFNRWGELLYETSNPAEGWDGYYKGKLCPQDVYVYRITAKFGDGQMVTSVGDINLLR